MTIEPIPLDSNQATKPDPGDILVNASSAHDVYDEDYYINGRRSKKSLYENYRWLPDLTLPMAERIIHHCQIYPDDTVLDFGCARGYLVKALRMRDRLAWGVDVSQWALENCDPEVKGVVSSQWPTGIVWDWVIAKDVLEHIEPKDLTPILGEFSKARKGVFIVVPLLGSGPLNTAQYAVPEYEADVTHVIRWPLDHWVGAMHHCFDHNWEISARYRIVGIKDNYAQWARGNGFITCRRIS